MSILSSQKETASAHYNKLMSAVIPSVDVSSSYGIRGFIDVGGRSQLCVQVCHRSDRILSVFWYPFLQYQLPIQGLPVNPVPELSAYSSGSISKTHLDTPFIKKYLDKFSTGKRTGFMTEPIPLVKDNKIVFSDEDFTTFCTDIVKTISKQQRLHQLSAYRDALGTEHE